MSSDEWRLIDALRARPFSRRSATPIVGIGDDAAVLPTSGTTSFLITVDMLIEGVHFDLRTATGSRVGYKAMAVNLSDIAAMAGRPTYAVVAIAIPKGCDESLPTEILQGLYRAADTFGVSIVGGDTNATSGPLTISVTLLGESSGRGPVLRSGGVAGDRLLVTGQLGGSLAGHHLDFIPRVNEAIALHARYQLHAMLDLSDGLASDVRHLTRESNVGARIDARRIPIQLGPFADDRSPIDHALYDGEDFELLFAVPEEDARRLLSDQPFLSDGVSVTEIGHLTVARDVVLIDDEGERPLPEGGYRHQW